MRRYAVSTLAIFLGCAVLAPLVSPASAVPILLKRYAKGLGEKDDIVTVRPSVVLDNDPDNEVASVELRVSSDGGDEDLVLTESDAWLHGSAALSALPVKDAALTLTLYDKGSASLMTFSGTLATDGTVTLDQGESARTCEVISKLGCTSLVESDVEVLAAEVYASGKGYALTLDLAGADTYEVAYATVLVSGGDKAEVDWDAVGSVWTAESTLEHTGVIDVKAKALDSEGNTFENIKAELAEPWQDEGAGVNVLSAGGGTSVALHRGRYKYHGARQVYHRAAMTVVSNGWTATSYPTHAELELAGGETVTVPANSYQRRYKKLNFVGGSPVGLSNNIEDTLRLGPDSAVSITSGSILLFEMSLSDLGAPVCSDGLCATLVAGETGEYGLTFTAYGTDPASLQDERSVLVDFLDDEIVAEEMQIVFEDEVTAVFASELEIDGDPMGGDASGSVNLLGAADKKGKQATLSKGSFYGNFSRDSDGDLALGGYGTNDWATSDTSAGVQLGEPVECGGEGCDGDWAPPVILYGLGGKITRIVISNGGLDYNGF